MLERKTRPGTAGVALRSLVALLTACAALDGSPPGRTLDVMTSGGFTAAYEILSPELTRKTGIASNTVYGASMGGAPTSIPSRLDRGEPADVVILAREGLERLAAKGQVIPGSRVDLADSLIGKSSYRVPRPLEAVPAVARTGMTPRAQGFSP